MTSVYAMMAAQMTILGFTLLHFCWQALIIAGLYKLVDMALPLINAQQRYMLSLLALLAMLMVAVVTFGYEEWRFSQASPEMVNAVAFIPAAATGGFRISQLIPALVIAWLLGVAALSMRTVGSLWCVSRLRLSAQSVPEDLARRFAITVRRLGLLGKVSLRLHPLIDSPFVVGAFRSVIYLPASALTALSPEQLDAVLAHELEHVRRADYAWNLVQSVIETLFFYHPAVWWLGNRLREQRELCCDDAALKTCKDPLTYATALLSLEEQRRIVPQGLVMALNGQGSGKSLLSRIARVLGEKLAPQRTERTNALWVLPVALFTVMALIAPLIQVAASAHSHDAKRLAEVQADKILTPEALRESLKLSDENSNISDTPEVAVPEMSDEDVSKVALLNLPVPYSQNIDPDAVAHQARAQALKARSELAQMKAMHIDVEAIAAQARTEAMQAKAHMARRGLSAADKIDVEAIVAQARADAENAKADVAHAAQMEIDVDKIAAEARQAAMQAKADSDLHSASYKMRKVYRTPPSPPAAPSPPSPPSPPAASPDAPPPLAALAAPKPPKAPKAPDAPKPPKPPKAMADEVTPVVYKGWVISLDPLKATLAKGKLAYAPPAAKTLNQLPQAAPAPIPSPSPVTDVVVHVNAVTTSNVHVFVK